MLHLSKVKKKCVQVKNKCVTLKGEGTIVLPIRSGGFSIPAVCLYQTNSSDDSHVVVCQYLLVFLSFAESYDILG